MIFCKFGIYTEKLLEIMIVNKIQKFFMLGFGNIQVWQRIPVGSIAFFQYGLYDFCHFVSIYIPFHKGIFHRSPETHTGF